MGRAGNRIILGLPGNPTSALVTARLFLAPLIAGLGGRDPQSALQWHARPLAADLEACGDRETFYRASLVDGAACPLSSQDSSAQKVLAMADLLVRRIPGAAAARAGELVETLSF